MEEETPKRYVVVCSGYTTDPLDTQRAAESLMAEINDLGYCSRTHTVEEI